MGAAMKTEPTSLAVNELPEQTSPEPISISPSATMPGSDDLDDLSKKNAPKTPPPVIPTGPYGPIVFIDGKQITISQPAMVHDFCATCDVRYDTERGHHVQFSEVSGEWEKKNPEQAMWAVTAYVMQLSVRLELPELVVKCKPSFLNNILKLVEGYAPLPKPSNPKLIPVENGVLDLSSGSVEFRRIRKDDYLTFKLKVPYVPGAKCPRFLSELIRPVLDGDDEQLLQHDFGRQLIPGNEAQTMSLFMGTAGSGKSILLLIHEGILGQECVAHLRSDKLNGNFETHAFQGKSILVGKDVNPDYLLKSGADMIKSLTGGDWCETEQKYGGKHGMWGTFYVNVTANSRLLVGLNDDAGAWRRRLVCYNFSRESPAKRIPKFHDVLLREEGPGILNWLLEGCLAHQAELAEYGVLRLTVAQQKRVDDLIMESDPERSFVKQCIKKGAGNLSSEELLDAYQAFARERNWHVPSEQAALTKINKLIPMLFGGAKSTNVEREGRGLRGFKGVVFKHEEPAAA